MALSVAMGLCGILVSLRLRLPVSVAWSTPGAALLATTGAIPGGFPAAVGAFLLAGLLIVLAGLFRPLGRWVAAIPAAAGERDAGGRAAQPLPRPGARGGERRRSGLPVVLVWAWSRASSGSTRCRPPCWSPWPDRADRASGRGADGLARGRSSCRCGRASPGLGDRHRGAAVHRHHGLAEHSRHGGAERQRLSPAGAAAVPRHRHRHPARRALRRPRGQPRRDHGGDVRRRGRAPRPARRYWAAATAGRRLRRCSASAPPPRPASSPTRRRS